MKLMLEMLGNCKVDLAVAMGRNCCCQNEAACRGNTGTASTWEAHRKQTGGAAPFFLLQPCSLLVEPNRESVGKTKAA